MNLNAKKRDVQKESFMQGVFTIMFSQIAIKIIGLIYTLYLTNRPGFGDRGNAIYSSGYQIYALLLTISSIGVPNAIAKLVSEKIAIGDKEGANKIFKIAFFTFAIIGFMGSLFLFLGAYWMANYLIQIPEAEMTLVALSPAIFFVSISSVMRGYFNGSGSLKTTAKAQTLEQIFKTLLTIIIVEIVAIFTNTSTELMAAGANLATTFAIFLSFSYLILYYKVNKKNENKKYKNEKQNLGLKKNTSLKNESYLKIIKNILYVSIPLTLSSIMGSLNKIIDTTTVIRILKKYMSEELAINKLRNIKWKN